jgi:hypothetical protein
MWPVPALAQKAPPPSLTVRVRWIVDLKKNFGYESFERVKDPKKTWKQQQGITFLTPEEVLVYQVKSGAEGSSHARFHMIAEIFDTRDGHELKRLVFPADSETGRIMPTRGGAFLVHRGNTLTVYSPKFEPLAMKDLPPSKTASSEEWQIDVSPSGTVVVAVHQLAWSDPKQKKTENKSQADVEVLDSQTLKPIKTFSVAQLDQWSAGDDAIITTDPGGDRGNSDFGVLDFEGKWRSLHTDSENDDPNCPYHVQPIQHQLIAAHDCDDFSVVTSDGTRRFSQPVRSGNFLISIANEGDYLAEAFVQMFSGRAFVSVFKLDKKEIVFQVSLEKDGIYYSISSSGTLAVADGERLKLFDAATPGDGGGDSAPRKPGDSL